MDWLELARLMSVNGFQYYDEKIFGFRAPLFKPMNVRVCVYIYICVCVCVCVCVCFFFQG